MVPFIVVYTGELVVVISVNVVIMKPVCIVRLFPGTFWTHTHTYIFSNEWCYFKLCNVAKIYFIGFYISIMISIMIEHVFWSFNKHTTA